MSSTLIRIAVIPGLIIIGYVYLKDKVEKEPLPLILKLIAFGAACCYVAGFAENVAAGFLPSYPKGTLNYALINAFLLAAFWEELIKFLALKLGSWKNSSFNYRFDGVVYGVSVAVGFAVLENVMYVSMYGFATALVRAFTAVPLHAFCGAAMGIFYSYAKEASILGQNGKSMFNRILALVVPMLIHGVYDTLAMMSSELASMLLIVFVAFLYIVMIRVIKQFSAADHQAGFYPRARVLYPDESGDTVETEIKSDFKL